MTWLGKGNCQHFTLTESCNAFTSCEALDDEQAKLLGWQED